MTQQALQALHDENERLGLYKDAYAQPERHELQAKGEHPAPCARHCEANAFKIVIRNLKATLAQPKQEPFCLHWEDRWGCNHYADPKEPHPVNAKPLYTTPPQRTWVGLTDEEIKPCWYEACQTDLELTSQLVVYFAKAIEAKLKEKNHG